MKHIIISRDGGALGAEDVEANFTDLHAPLTPGQAVADAARCLYCYDAPCVTACPTAIDIPTFIHQIRSRNLDGSARTILSANILGGTCARACPTEVLCEQACVVNHTEGAPIKIGLLQRHAVDDLMYRGGDHPFTRAPATGRKLAVIGAGPAGLSFAHRASMLGHDVVIFEKEAKSGGLNEYGLAAYKMADDFAQREVEFLLGIGGIEIKTGMALGRDVTLDGLLGGYDAVFLGIGQLAPTRLDVPGSTRAGTRYALDFIKDIRSADSVSSVPVGRDVVVIGGGNTAIDAAMQAKCLGAERVTMLYRRGPEQMSATLWEQDLARANNINIIYWAAPKSIDGDTKTRGLSWAATRLVDSKLTMSDKTRQIEADMVLIAIGQSMQIDGAEALERERGKFKVGADYQTSLDRVYAGGDAIASGEDLTVQAVEDGKRAAIAVDARLQQAQGI